MSSRLRFLLSFGALIFCAVSGISAADGADGWTVVSTAPDLTVYERARKGATLLEHKGVGIIDAEPIVVKRVLDDTEEYPHFMPYVIETKTISRTADKRIGYQRLSPPLVGDRDYTVQITYETKPAPGGGECYCNKWQVANDLGPAEKKGVTRIKVTEGYWLLEPTADGHQTRATYFIYCESGGSMPAFILNTANKTAIPKLFEAVRKQAKLEKYHHK